MGERGAKNMWVLKSIGISESIAVLVVALAVLSGILLTGCSDEQSSGSADTATPVSSPTITETPTSPDSEVGKTREPTEEPEGGSAIFAPISAGGFHTCLVQTDGAIECWGANVDVDGNVIGQATLPSDRFASVSAGMFHTCGVKTDGSVACWGLNEDGDGTVIGQATPPPGEFTTVSAGGAHTCGVKTDGSIACWGLNRDFDDTLGGQATPPAS